MDFKYLKNFSNKRKNKENDLFTLWISDDGNLPELQQLSLKSMLLTGHDVKLYVYDELENVPEGIQIMDGNEILSQSNIFKYNEGFNKGSYSGFANWFRAKCLYEKGFAWFDCDIIAVKNINEMSIRGPLISSQRNPDGEISPNNAFLRLNKRDKFLKYMIDYMDEVKDNVMHGDTGPSLLKSLMDTKYNSYSKYLANVNFIASVNYFDFIDLLKPSSEIVPRLKFNEIWGFHIWNAMFRNNEYMLEKSRNSFYQDLKEIILTSSTKEEYAKKISSLFEIN
ncbi:MAG: hypothetical protein CVV28_11860 [Methanobacteriales archaeon HGW-Methanobacteriales-1]|nr:MAG: hypothetical protein CVV28_11860 [Methanobacteriales archaeon HGW-Methanobacteriales-1]